MITDLHRIWGVAQYATQPEFTCYESVQDRLDTFTKEQYLKDPEATVQQVFDIYRSINITPIVYYTEQGLISAIKDLSETVTNSVKNNVINLGNNQGQGINRFLFPNMMTAEPKGRGSNSLKDRFLNDAKLRRAINLCFEYREGNKILDRIDKAVGDIDRSYIFGNHEDRYFRHIKEKDNAKYGGALINPCEALYLHERGWEVKTDWQSDYFTLGKHLDIVHGVYTSIHAAKAHLDKTQHSVMFGHTHRVQCYHTGNKAAFNIGGLFDIKSKGFSYMPRFQRQLWANGFALVNVDDQGNFYAEQVNVWADKFLANGKMY